MAIKKVPIQKSQLDEKHLQGVGSIPMSQTAFNFNPDDSIRFSPVQEKNTLKEQEEGAGCGIR